MSHLKSADILRLSQATSCKVSFGRWTHHTRAGAAHAAVSRQPLYAADRRPPPEQQQLLQVQRPRIASRRMQRRNLRWQRSFIGVVW